MLKRSRLVLGEFAAVISMLLALSSVTLGSGPDVIVDNSLSTSDPMATPPEYKTWLEMIDEETLTGGMLVHVIGTGTPYTEQFRLSKSGVRPGIDDDSGSLSSWEQLVDDRRRG